MPSYLQTLYPARGHLTRDKFMALTIGQSIPRAQEFSRPEIQPFRRARRRPGPSMDHQEADSAAALPGGRTSRDPRLAARAARARKAEDDSAPPMNGGARAQQPAASFRAADEDRVGACAAPEPWEAPLAEDHASEESVQHAGGDARPQTRLEVQLRSGARTRLAWQSGCGTRAAPGHVACRGRAGAARRWLLEPRRGRAGAARRRVGAVA